MTDKNSVYSFLSSSIIGKQDVPTCKEFKN